MVNGRFRLKARSGAPIPSVGFGKILLSTFAVFKRLPEMPLRFSFATFCCLSPQRYGLIHIHLSAQPVIEEISEIVIGCDFVLIHSLCPMLACRSVVLQPISLNAKVIFRLSWNFTCASSEH